MVHQHRALGQREERIFIFINPRLFEWLIPQRQRVKVRRQTLSIYLIIRLRAIVQTLSGEAKFLQRLGIYLHDDRLGFAYETHVSRYIQVFLVGKAVVFLAIRPMVREERLVLDVLFPLFRIRLALERLFAILATPASQKADAGRTLVIDDEIRVVLELARTVGVGKRREFQTRGHFHQHFLPWPHVAVEFQQRVANRVGRCIRFRDRTIQQRNRVVTLQIRGIRQHQIGKVDHLGVERVYHHQKRDLVLTRLFRVFFAQHVLHVFGVHGRVPRHVRHEQHQRIDGIGIMVGGVGNHHVHQAMRRNRDLPRIGLVDAQRVAVRVNHQVFRPHRETQRRARQRRVRRVDDVLVVFRQLVRRHRFRIRRTGAEVARAVKRPQQHLDQVHCTAGVKTVRVSSDAAHRVHRHRAANHLVVFATPAVGPLNIQLDSFLECYVRHLQRHTFDGFCRHATFFRHVLGRVTLIQVTLGGQAHYRAYRTPIGCNEIAEQRGRNVLAQPVDEGLLLDVPHQRIACLVAQEQAIACLARGVHHQPGRVGVTNQKIPVEQLA